MAGSNARKLADLVVDAGVGAGERGTGVGRTGARVRSGLILRNHVRRELGEDSGLAGVLMVEHMPMTDGAVDVEYLALAVAEGRCILFEDPRDDVERRLAAIWSAQMDLRSVGVNDDFLELGGDSLSALGIIAAIETEFGRPLDVYEFMSAANVRRLAEILR